MIPESPVPTERCILRAESGDDRAAEEHQSAGAMNNGLVSHESRLVESREAQSFGGRRGSAPGNLFDHPVLFLTVGDLPKEISPITDHADFFIAEEGIGSGGITDRVNVERENIRGNVV